MELGSATFAFLMEPDDQGGLSSTAMAGLEAPLVRSGAGEDQPPTLTAYTTGKPVLVDDVAALPGLDRALWDTHGRPASMLFQPVLRGDKAVGVLVIGWAERVPAGRRPAIVSLLASEAAFAIEAADLVGELTDLASIDALTGVPNRRAWDHRIATALGDPDAAPLCVALLDLDRFKAYNDTWGHQGGDRLLKEASAAWRSTLRPEDLLARYGGEEFAVLLSGCTLERARSVVDRLRAMTPGRETCSAGIAQWDGTESVEALTERADRALYAAKAAGRDRTIA